MEQVVQELGRLKGEIDKARQERSELVGAEKQYLSRLKGEFGLADEAAARKELEALGKKKEKLEGEIRVGFDKLKEEYEW